MHIKSLSVTFFLLTLFFGVYVLPAQNDLSAKVDEFVRLEMQKQKIPGVAVAVVKDAKPLLIKGYGLANIEHQIPVKPETIFQSGSVGKQFTSAAIMLLVEDGKIALDDKIGKYLGEVPEAWQNITIRHLLSHTSGMTDYPEGFDFRLDYTEDDLLKRIREIPLAFEPGERWQYSNIGYVTLGIIVRKASGKFYGDFLQERVFKPFGMNTARVISEADIIPNRAAGYRLVNGEIKNQGWVSPSLNTTADGALYLTLHDMLKWDEALSNGKLLREVSLAESWKPITLNGGKVHPYGFGWAVREINGIRVIEHGGAWQGFKAHIQRVPDNKLSVIVFANLAQANQSKIANGIAAIYNQNLIPKPIKDNEPAVTADLRQVLKSLTSGTADRSRFTPDAQKVVFEGNDRVLQFLRTLGPIEAFSLMERQQEEADRLYRYRVDYSGMSVFFVVRLNAEGRISRLALQPE